MTSPGFEESYPNFANIYTQAQEPSSSSSSRTLIKLFLVTAIFTKKNRVANQMWQTSEKQ
jgi:hypothetical protein